MKKGFIVIGSFLVGLLATVYAYAETSPSAEMKITLDEVLKVVEALPGDKNLEQRRIKLREVINPRFDFREMSQRSLGTNWEGKDPVKQEEFVTIFSELLAKTYLAKIELVQRDTVQIGKEEVEMPKALVRTTITYKGDKFPLDYKLIFKEGTWKVYDVIIENIGLVANYRNEFAGIIRKDGFDGLIEQLKKKK